MPVHSLPLALKWGVVNLATSMLGIYQYMYFLIQKSNWAVPMLFWRPKKVPYLFSFVCCKGRGWRGAEDLVFVRLMSMAWGSLMHTIMCFPHIHHHVSTVQILGYTPLKWDNDYWETKSSLCLLEITHAVLILDHQSVMILADLLGWETWMFESSQGLISPFILWQLSSVQHTHMSRDLSSTLVPRRCEVC